MFFLLSTSSVPTSATEGTEAAGPRSGRGTSPRPVASVRTIDFEFGMNRNVRNSSKSNGIVVRKYGRFEELVSMRVRIIVRMKNHTLKKLGSPPYYNLNASILLELKIGMGVGRAQVAHGSRAGHAQIARKLRTGCAQAERSIKDC